jgi:transcriptional regulator of met regulon
LYTIDDFGELFDETTLKVFLYITLGLIVYHLIIKKLITKYTTNEHMTTNSTPTPKTEILHSAELHKILGHPLPKGAKFKKPKKKVTFKEK